MDGAVPAACRPGHRLLLGRVRAASIAADLRRRSWRTGRRSLQGSGGPRRAADRRRVHVSAGLLPPAHFGRRLAGGELRAPQLDGRADRAGDDPRRPAVRDGGAARRSIGAGGGLAGAHGTRQAVPARHRPRGKRAVGSRALGPALRRRSRNPDPAGNPARHRRRAGVEGARRRIRRCFTSTRATRRSSCCSASGT